MEFTHWLSLVGATIALLAIPGPVVMLLLGHTLGRGPRAAAAVVPGVMLGDLAAMSASLLGAGALLSASADLFLALKIAGAAYLLWLGFGLWRAPADGLASARQRTGGGLAAFRDGFLVTAFNPKDIVFFVAFLPQFLSADRALLPQVLTIQATFLALLLVSNALWILLGATLTGYLREGGRLRIANRAGASALVGAGFLTAFAR
ncbi:MAG: LysE family translocator [Alphaproteobacteria bacterium]|nr:LysE family translocator [Alphaproteobacteria bacterium]